MDKLEMLALLYVQNVKISFLSPERLYDSYEEAYNRIKKRHDAMSTQISDNDYSHSGSDK